MKRALKHGGKKGRSTIIFDFRAKLSIFVQISILVQRSGFRNV
jgi:hypothetical protein